MDQKDTIAITKSTKKVVDNLIKGFEKEHKRLQKLEEKNQKKIDGLDAKIDDLDNQLQAETDEKKRTKLQTQRDKLGKERDDLPSYEDVLSRVGEAGDDADYSVLGRLSQISSDLDELLRKGGQYEEFFKERKDVEG
jgi:phage shock protein A